MYANGLYIQDVSKDMANFLSEGKFRLADRVYNGVARYIHFPLLRRSDESSKTITDTMTKNIYEGLSLEDDILPLWVINDFNLYNEYLKQCERLKIKIRILFIESTRQYPLWQGALPELKTIGYEIINPNLCDESFCWLLNTEKYKHYAEKLNQYGLFDDFETAEAFYNELNEKENGFIEECDGLIARISVLKYN